LRLSGMSGGSVQKGSPPSNSSRLGTFLRWMHTPRVSGPGHRYVAVGALELLVTTLPPRCRDIYLPSSCPYRNLAARAETRFSARLGPASPPKTDAYTSRNPFRLHAPISEKLSSFSFFLTCSSGPTSFRTVLPISVPSKEGRPW